MESISEIISLINKLPKGNIYKKRINGKTYYYHQYFQNGKRYSRIISYDDVATLQEKINKRIELEKQLKKLSSKDYSVRLSKSAKELTGQVMSGNVPVAKFQNGKLLYINEKICPLIIKRTHSVEEFLKLRVMDMSRTNARILKKALNIQVNDDYIASLYAYALSVSDNYWFKPRHSKLQYKSIRFNNDFYSDVSLKGIVTSFSNIAKLTPEITTTGSFEKGWKYIDGIWWLYKSENDSQLFSELFCYEFARLIDLDTAIYEFDEGYIRSKNFADKMNFEPLASIMGNNDKYQDVFKSLYKINKDIAKQYVKLIFFDSVINNIDRHNENTGLMRDRKNGRIISLAPNFDNNLALISTGDIKSDCAKDGFVKIFVDFLKNSNDAKNLFVELKFKELTIDDIESILYKIPIKMENGKEICRVVFERYNYLKNLFNKQHN